MLTSTFRLGFPWLVVFACSACSSGSPSGDVSGDEPELKTGEASLVVPLIDEKKQLLSRFNTQAKAKGLKETPDTIEIKTAVDGKRVMDACTYFASEVGPAVGAKSDAICFGHPADYTNWSKTRKVPGLCYRGNPNAVVGVIERGRDGAFSDQLFIHGWRYKTAKHLSDGANEYEDTFPDVWAEWRGEGTAILVIASQGDSGDDLTPAILPRCK